MKSIFKSKTFLASAFSFVTGAAMLSSNPAVVTVATICNDPSVQAQLLLIISGVVHALLRSVTDKPVSLL